MALSLVEQLALNFDFSDTPPPAVGGGETPLTPDQIAYICSVQRAIPSDANMGFYRVVARFVANRMGGLNVDFILAKLRDTSLCADISASLLPQKGAPSVADTPMYLGANGFPLSRNPTWMACFEAEYANRVLIKEDIKNNPDKDKDGTPRDCAYYHANSSNIWYHPELKIYFTYNPQNGSYKMPSGYVAVRTAFETASN